MDAGHIGFWAFFLGFMGIILGLTLGGGFILSLFKKCPKCGKWRPKLVKSELIGGKTTTGGSYVNGRWKANTHTTTKGTRYRSWNCRSCDYKWTQSSKDSVTRQL
jgi:hypothetical protein